MPTDNECHECKRRYEVRIKAYRDWVDFLEKNMDKKEWERLTKDFIYFHSKAYETVQNNP